MNGCPRIPSQPRDENIILPYWCSYFKGKVFAFELREEEQRNRILEDVNAVNNAQFIEANNANNINIIVITWYKMRSSGFFADARGFTVRT